MPDQEEQEDNSIIIATFPKNNREAICMGISEYKGKNLLFIRAYVPTFGDGLIPTRNGISLGIDKCDELITGIKALEDVMSNEKIVAKIKKNGKEEVRIAVSTYREIPLIQIRTYAAYKEGDEMKPTKKGVSMNVNLLPQLVESAEKLSAAVKALGTNP